MHRSVLQNKKYMKFAQKSTVEVITYNGLDKAVAAGNAMTATFKARDGVERLVGWPSLTMKQLQELNRSKAARYPNSGYPHTLIINPHDLSVMEEFSGGRPTSTLMDASAAHGKSLRKQYGKGISRRTLAKLNKQAAGIRHAQEAGKLGKALADLARFGKAVASMAEPLQAKAQKLEEELLAAARRKLDELEALIARGEKKQAARELGSLARALKGTPLESRASELLEKAKAG